MSNMVFNMQEMIEKKLLENLRPKFLEIRDNSKLHMGHSGVKMAGENVVNTGTHFAITIESDLLKNLTLIQSHRKINKVLEEEFENGLHALEIKIKNSE